MDDVGNCSQKSLYKIIKKKFGKKDGAERRHPSECGGNKHVIRGFVTKHQTPSRAGIVFPLMLEQDGQSEM